jgi:hypothetical protein
VSGLLLAAAKLLEFRNHFFFVYIGQGLCEPIGGRPEFAKVG